MSLESADEFRLIVLSTILGHHRIQAGRKNRSEMTHRPSATSGLIPCRCSHAGGHRPSDLIMSESSVSSEAHLPKAIPPALQIRPALREWLAIARPWHYGKHVLILVGIALAGWLDPPSITTTLVGRITVGLLAACLIASSNYVLNGILDAATDRHHPRKRRRPLVEGRIRAVGAYKLWFVLGLLGLASAASLGSRFLCVAAAFLGMALLYNVPPCRLKDIPYVDILTEAINSPLRLLLGWALIEPQRLPDWSLLLAAWMAGGVAMTWKRLTELREFDHAGSAAAYRRSFASYDKGRLSAMIVVEASAAAVFGVLALYSLASGSPS